MNLSELSGTLESIPLPPEQKTPILQLIDAKINNDMKQVIAKLDHLESKLSNEIKVVYWVVGIAMAILLFFAAKK